MTEIFVVDDDESVRRALERLLRSAGYRVRGFALGVRGPSGTGPQPPWLPHHRRPHAGGATASSCSTSSAGADPVPVIFITGHGDVAMAVRAMKAGAVDFLAKPFDDEALLGAIAHAVRQVER